MVTPVMFTANIDLGQILVGSLIAIVGWFVKKEIATFGRRIDRHEDILMTMAQNLSRVVGEVGILMRIYDRREDSKDGK